MASVAVIVADPKQSGVKRLKQERIALPEEIDNASICDEIVGSSAALKKCCLLRIRLLPQTRPYWSRAKPGTGKELVARAIHKRSRRSDLLSASTVLARRRMHNRSKLTFVGSSRHES